MIPAATFRSASVRRTMVEGGKRWAGSALAALLFSGTVAADPVYRWVDKNGEVHYSDQPAPNAQQVEINSVPPTASPADQAAAQQAAAECQQKREQLARYRNAAAITETNALGRTHTYTAEEKHKLIERTQSWIDQNCGGAEAPPAE